VLRVKKPIHKLGPGGVELARKVVTELATDSVKKLLRLA
jgi:hypothetical protein